MLGLDVAFFHRSIHLPVIHSGPLWHLEIRIIIAYFGAFDQNGFASSMRKCEKKTILQWYAAMHVKLSQTRNTAMQFAERYTAPHIVGENTFYRRLLCRARPIIMLPPITGGVVALW